MAKYALIGFLTLGLIHQATALNIPATLQNGVYEITFEPEAKVQPEVQVFHYAMDPYTNFTSTTDHGQRLPPKKQVLTCTNNEDRLDGGDVALAQRMLENWCEGHGLHRRASVLAVHNDAVWYTCSYVFQFPRKKYEVCGRSEIAYATDAMNRACGRDGVASMIYFHLAEYGRARLGGNICGDWGATLDVLRRNDTSAPCDEE
ncbi:hypothetical protein E4U42_004218 [Claviceps africana]|uniref:Ecp2 effector protein domain-containing protein n=1 Tax=Claviceps africana TaxID=83212 RepID=A0A8K0NH60_9HYPO|nr:hypothetical protein E4U42_004218 [Claviceps africana]